MTTLSTVHVGSYAPGTTANPFTILAGGTITASTGYAMSLASSASWYLLNQGLITAASGTGVDIASGTIVNQATIGGSHGVVITGTASVFNQGTIAGGVSGKGVGVFYLSNASTGAITSSQYAVYDQNQAATVINAGTIQGETGIYANHGLTLVNTGTILGSSYPAVVVRQGGADITNAAGGTILGYEAGIVFSNAGGTVVNAGTIAHGSGGQDAIDVSNGNATDIVVDPGAVFTGIVKGNGNDTLEFASGSRAGTLDGLGSQYTGFGTYRIDAGAAWTATGANTVASRLIDAGTLYGVLTLASTGAITVQSGGLISGAASALAMLGGDATNAGLIEANTDAISISGAATLTNSGTILDGGAGRGNAAVYVQTGGLTVDNQAGGTISANYYAILDESGLLAVNNAGTIIGTHRDAVYGNTGLNLTNSGVIHTGANYYAALGRQEGVDVTNIAGGYIGGGRIGVGIGNNGIGTIINAGTIAGSQDAVLIGGVGGPYGATGRVIVDPGAVFKGKVESKTLAAALEFAAGTTAGTFAGLGSQYTGFGSATVDAGATWTATSSNLLNGLTVAGSLAIAGYARGPAVLAGGTLDVLGGATLAQYIGQAAIYGTGYVTNAGTITVTSGIYAISFNAGGTVENSGLIAGRYGIGITGAAGSITNTGTILASGGTGSAVNLAAGGRVVNTAGATIGGHGVGVIAAAGVTVDNAGTILAGTTTPGTYFDAVTFAPGAGNRMILEPGSTLRGTIDGGNTLGAADASTLEFAAGATSGTFGAIQSQYTYFGQIGIDAGATWTASSYSNLYSGETLTNNGTIAMAASLLGGFFLRTGASMTNAAGATITGGKWNAVVADTGGSLVNAGLISSGTFGGAHVYVGAIVTNLATGTIAGSNEGFSGGGGTLVNAGTILAGNAGDIAVSFASGTAASLVVDPGAVFSGTVSGGNSIGSGVTSTLEFAAGTASGTFTGLGSHYVDFGQVSIDSGATWTAAGSNTLASGYTLSDPGLLIVASTLVNYGNITGGTYGVSLAGGATLINSGTITNTAGSKFDGVVEVKFGTTGGASVTNASGGVITSGHTDVYQGTGALTVVNQGTITASSGYAIYANNGLTLDNSGFIAASGEIGAVDARSGTLHVSNAPGGVISGSDVGLVLGSGSGTVINDGTIEGSSTGVLIEAGDTGTVINAGTLAAGPGGYAVAFHHGYAGLLVVDPGAVFIGTIGGANAIGSTAVSTLEFAAGSGTLAGFGTTVFDFAEITLDTGANWFLSGTAYGFGGGEAITGLTTGSTIELTGTVESYAALAAGMLTLSGGTTLDLPGLAFADVSNDGTNTFITACFASGTRIAGRFGAVPVEALRAGDLVRTACGRLAPVRWLGFRRTNLAHHPRPLDVMPVRVHAHAFGRSLPSRDLILSPDHAVYIDGRLIPIRYLINNVSIVQETRAAITYWHVELDEHDVILAEGLPCESYLDTGNRSAFDNAPGAVQMTPDFARRTWHEQGCAPIVVDPADPVLRRLHTRLMARAIRTRRAA
jgi:hypothetical protein